MNVISIRLWQQSNSQKEFFNVKVVRGTEGFTALLDTTANYPRDWRLIDRQDGHEIREWKFADEWQQTWLHEHLDRMKCNDLLVTPVKYDRAAL